jgi:hypothetical protein
LIGFHGWIDGFYANGEALTTTFATCRGPAFC